MSGRLGDAAMRPSLSFIIFSLFLFTTLFVPVSLMDTVQGQGYDVSVSDGDVSIDPAEPYAGDLVRISVVVRNKGATAENVAVAFYLGGELVDSHMSAVVPTSATAIGDWNTTGLAPGDYTINITAVAQGDTNSSNNNASVVITLEKRPEAVITIEGLEVVPKDVVDGDVVEVVGRVRNSGDIDTTRDAVFLVDGVTLEVKDLVLAKGDVKNVTAQWDTTGLEGEHEVALNVADKMESVMVTVGHRPVPFMVVERVWLDSEEPVEKTKVKVYAEVRNIGDEVATDVVVVFKDNVKTFAKTKARTYAANESHIVTVEWTAKTGKRVIRVEVEGYPDAVNHDAVEGVPLSARGCGYQVAFIGAAVVVGGVGLVRYKRKKRRRGGKGGRS